MKPNICILKTDGTNCDQETKYAFERAGGNADIVLMNQLKANPKLLHRYSVLAIPGGFSFGDDIASGVILATELLTHIQQELTEFMQQKKLIIGICNGFQVLVRAGLLPTTELGAQSASLIDNDSGHFECRWVDMVVEESPCIFTKSLQGETVSFQAAHAQGKYIAAQPVLESIEQQNLVALRYINNSNPNGSLNNIAGICDATGRIFGLMPHPERFVSMHQYPNWRRQKLTPHGLPIFENAIEYVRKF